MKIPQVQNFEKIISQIKIIPDVPLDTLDELKFGHKEITQTLRNIIQNTDDSTTIGLFGHWGSGKSSIINALRQLLQKESKSIPTIVFDVWKHQEDALRRTFLRECVKQLQSQGQLSNDREVSDRVDKIVESSVENSKINPKSIKVLAGMTSLFAVAILVINAISIGSITAEIVTNSILWGGLFAILIWLPNNTQFLMSRYTTHIIEDRFSDPVEFETEFIEIVQAIDAYKIVIAFDNLDRVTENKAIEVLSTVKTFLEPKFEDSKYSKSVIFLIPCDNNAIRRYIKNLYFVQSNGTDTSNSDLDSEEFLNKFFNCTVTIPDFIPSEFETYTLSLLEKCGIPQFQSENQIKNDVAWIIVQAYRRNPRRLIHFINDLSGYYIHILNRIISGEFESTFIDKNLPQMTKYLILEKKFPETLQKMKYYGYANPQRFVEQGIPSDMEIPKISEFKEFVCATRDVEIENIYLFSHRRLSESEKRFPGIHNLFRLMEQGDRKGLHETLDILQLSEDNESDFSNVLKDELEKKKLKQSKVNFINSLLYIKANMSIKYKPELYITIYNKIEGSFEILPLLYPSLVFESLIRQMPIPNRVDRLVIQWIDNLHTYDLLILKELLNLIFSKSLHVPDHKKYAYLQNLRKCTLDLEIVSMICDLDIKSQAEFLDEGVVQKMIEGGLLIGNDGNLSRLNQISANLVSVQSLQYINEKLISSFESNFDNWTQEEQRTFIQEYAGLLRNYIENYGELYRKATKQFNDFITRNLQFSQKLRSKYESLPFIIELTYITTKHDLSDQTQVLKRRIVELLQVTNAHHLKFLDPGAINRLYNLDKPLLQSILIQQQKSELFAIFYVDLDDEVRQNLLDLAFKHDVRYGLSICEMLRKDQIEPLITQQSLEICLDSLCRNANTLSHRDRLSVLGICEETKCFNEPKLVDKYVSLIKMLLINESEQKNRTDYISKLRKSTFLLPEKMRVVIKSIHGHLIEHGIPSELSLLGLTILKAGEMLTVEERDQLVQLIFDQVLRENKPAHISELFKYLSELKPLFSKCEVNFWDVKQRIESSSGDVRNALICGVLLLKSSNRRSKRSKDYWVSIEKLSAIDS